MRCATHCGTTWRRNKEEPLGATQKTNVFSSSWSFKYYISPKPFFSSLIALLSYRLTLDEHDFLGSHYPCLPPLYIFSLAISSFGQLRIECSAMRMMYLCESQKADLFIDLEPLTQFYYCSKCWHFLSDALPVTFDLIVFFLYELLLI